MNTLQAIFVAGYVAVVWVVTMLLIQAMIEGAKKEILDEIRKQKGKE